MKVFAVVLMVLQLTQIVRWVILLMYNKIYTIDRWDMGAFIALWALALMTTVTQYGKY